MVLLFYERHCKVSFNAFENSWFQIHLDDKQIQSEYYSILIWKEYVNATESTATMKVKSLLDL